ncbi:MAG: tryptophan--tRNA ligase, partial [Desulfofundulus sp.]
RLSRVSVLPGVDGRKMSKSYANDIGLMAGPDEIRERVNAMITDPARIRKTDPGHPEVCVVHKYHGIYTADRLTEIEEDCRAGRVGCVACKKLLAASLEAVLAPLRERRQQITDRPGYVKEVLAEGARRARAEAVQTMAMVREAMRI